MSGLCLLIKILLISSYTLASNNIRLPGPIVNNEQTSLLFDSDKLQIMALTFAVGSLIQLIVWIGSLVKWALGKSQDRMKHIDEALQRIENKVEILERTNVTPEMIISLVREELKYEREFRDRQ